MRIINIPAITSFLSLLSVAYVQSNENGLNVTESLFSTGAPLNLTVPQSCGNGVCDKGENCLNCPMDCISGTSGGYECGNGVCEDGEHCYTCPEDCNLELEEDGADKFCCYGGPQDPEVPFSVACDEDIRCGEINGKCSSKSSPLESYCCGDGLCNGEETELTCPIDSCVSLCGNGKCDMEEGEDADSCLMDCQCNYDGTCDPWETVDACSIDCTCGNFVCDYLLGENMKNCPSDCGCNANHHCEAWEDTSCEMDNCYEDKDDDTEHGFDDMLDDDFVCKDYGESCEEHSQCCSFTCDVYVEDGKQICVG